MRLLRDRAESVGRNQSEPHPCCQSLKSRTAVLLDIPVTESHRHIVAKLCDLEVVALFGSHHEGTKDKKKMLLLKGSPTLDPIRVLCAFVVQIVPLPIWKLFSFR